MEHNQLDICIPQLAKFFQDNVISICTLDIRYLSFELNHSECVQEMVPQFLFNLKRYLATENTVLYPKEIKEFYEKLEEKCFHIKFVQIYLILLMKFRKLQQNKQKKKFPTKLDALILEPFQILVLEPPPFPAPSTISKYLKSKPISLKMFENLNNNTSSEKEKIEDEMLYSKLYIEHIQNVSANDPYFKFFILSIFNTL